eukprot:2169333-Prymnesium_polylepis.1
MSLHIATAPLHNATVRFIKKTSAFSACHFRTVKRGQALVGRARVQQYAERRTEVAQGAAGPAAPRA